MSSKRPTAHTARVLRTAAACAVWTLALVQILSPSSFAATPGPEVFGALPVQTNVVLSPDGRWLAWVDHQGARPRVVMFDVAARKPQRILQLPERLKLRRLLWNDNETLLVTLSETAAPVAANYRAREFYLTTAYDVGGGDGRMLPGGNEKEGAFAAAHSVLIRVRTSKPHTVIMASYVGKGGASCLLEVDTRTGDFGIIKTGNAHTVGWMVDRDGVPLAREDWDWTKRAYRLYALSDKELLREILRSDDADQPNLQGLLADDSALVLLSGEGRPHQVAWALPLNGSPRKLLAEDPDGDITGASVDPYTGAILGVFVEDASSKVHWLDPTAQHRQDLVQRAFPNRTVALYGWTEDGNKTLAYVASGSMAPVYYLVDFTTHRADIAAEEYPALEGVKLGELSEITYKARDGTDIPAYLTVPAAKLAAAGPLVVLPHGGPFARDYPRFDWMVQFLASRGYTVLQPQFRGSTGFGDAFRDAGYRQLGGLMQDDVTDGVNAMIARGVADPKRICIVGMSYGGYAALAGAAFTPKLYSCAVSVNGISDLQALMQEEVPMYGTGVRYISSAQSWWKERIGSPTDSALEKRSPIHAVSAIVAPILIVYGTGDGVVANSQSEKMAKALSSAGKPVTVVKLPDEDHWLSRGETRVQLLQALDAFLSAHL